MGTRFIATREAPVHENVKQALVAATELDTRLVMRPLRNTERVLRNAAVDRILEKERTLGADIRFDDIVEEVAGVYPRIMKEGALDAGACAACRLDPRHPDREGTRRSHRERGDGDHPQSAGRCFGLSCKLSRRLHEFAAVVDLLPGVLSCSDHEHSIATAFVDRLSLISPR